MELITRSRERRRIAFVVVVLVLTLLIALVYTVVSSREATSAAVETMSEVYLQELSDQVIAHFNTGIDGKFCQIDTSWRPSFLPARRPRRGAGLPRLHGGRRRGVRLPRAARQRRALLHRPRRGRRLGRRRRPWRPVAVVSRRQRAQRDALRRDDRARRCLRPRHLRRRDLHRGGCRLRREHHLRKAQPRSDWRAASAVERHRLRRHLHRRVRRRGAVQRRQLVRRARGDRAPRRRLHGGPRSARPWTRATRSPSLLVQRPSRVPVLPADGQPGLVPVHRDALRRGGRGHRGPQGVAVQNVSPHGHHDRGGHRHLLPDLIGWSNATRASFPTRRTAPSAPRRKRGAPAWRKASSSRACPTRYARR